MIQLTENAKKVLEARYLLKDAKGKVTETPEQLFKRVAFSIAEGEKKFCSAKERRYWQEKFYEVMSNLLFLPNSPTLMNAGTKCKQLSACFVLPIKDSIDGIFKTLHHSALIQKSGGGTGFNFSHLRPENDPVSYPGNKASGPIAFMKIFDATTDQVRQGGKRRGANMGILSVSHPDIEKFIASKSDEGVLSNFNISVLVPDLFLKAVEKNKEWKLIHPVTDKITGVVKARKLWKAIIHSAYTTGDPGIVFYDSINRKNPTPDLGKIECTNPCGEVPLLDYEPCNLGSINISRMISGKKINWELLEETIFTAIRFLDDVIEVNDYILPEIEKMAKSNRKIGLGIMGWADALMQLNISYASERAVKLGERLMKFMNDKSIEASIQLAKERGVFPNWKKSIYYPDKPIRNATRTSIAPTGTLSIIAGTSPSIEPMFAISFSRKHILNNQTLTENNRLFFELMDKEKKISKVEWNIIQKTGSLKNIKGIPREIKKVFLTAHEIHWLFHVKHQIVFQKYTDNAVSKTINMPEKISKREVERAFLYAWKHKAKGITVFREGSKKKQILNKGTINGILTYKEEGACPVCFNLPNLKA